MARKLLSFQDLVRRRQQSGFVGREDHLTLFRNNFDLTLDDRHRHLVFNVWGDGGVGKTLLLRQFYDISMTKQALSAYVDEHISDAPEAMTVIASQIGSAFHEFNKKYAEYLKKRDQLLHDPDAPLDAWSRLTRTAVKVTLHASKALPVVGPVVDLVSADDVADAAEQVRTYLSRKLSDGKSIRLLMNPVDELSPYFVRGLTEAGSWNKLALFFDTYERTSPVLETWLQDLLQGRFGDLPASLVLVIAGRNQLHSSRWSDYLDVVASIHLKPFTEREARRLLAIKGVTDKRVVKTIIQLSGRLPLLVALLAEGRPSDPSDVDDPSGTAVEHFLKWEPDQQRREAVMISALPRRIDADILGILTNKEDARPLFQWLCNLPFVTMHAERYEFHDIVRAPMIRMQRSQSRQNWSESHKKLADAHSSWRDGLTSKDSWLNDQWFYHRIEQMYHNLCVTPSINLPHSLVLAVAAAKAGTSAARRWAEMIRDAGHDSDDTEVRRWGERLLDTVSNQYHECSEFLTELLTNAPLTSAARVEALVERGRIYYSTNREADALTDLTAAIRTDPQIRKAWDHKSGQNQVPSSIAVDAYLDTDDEVVGEQVLAALDELASLLGYDGPHDEQTQRGSIYRRALAKLRAKQTSSEASQRLAQIERAIELHYIDKPSVEYESAQSEAIARLISALDSVPRACIRIGSLLLVKFENDKTVPNLLVRNLTASEITILDEHPEILKDPASILRALSISPDSLAPSQSLREDKKQASTDSEPS